MTDLGNRYALSALRSKRGELAGVRLELAQIGAKQSDLHWPRRSGEIVDHVRQDLHELDVQPRHGARDLVADFRNHLEGGPASLAGRLETRDDVARVLFGGEEAELGTRPPRAAGDLRRLRENALDDVELAVGFGECRAAGVK